MKILVGTPAYGETVTTTYCETMFWLFDHFRTKHPHIRLDHKFLSFALLPYMRNYFASRVLNDWSAKVDVDLGAVTLTSVTALSKVGSFIDEDLDYTPADATAAQQRLKAKNFSQELRISSDGAGPTSTSRLLSFKASGNRLETTTRMAFWLRPGETSAGHPARREPGHSRT